MKEKNTYLAPECEVLAVCPEGVVAASEIPDFKDGGQLW